MYNNQQNILTFLNNTNKINEKYDFRDIYTMCIDKEGTIKCDDAISLLRGEDSDYLLIHITDVVDEHNHHNLSTEKIASKVLVHNWDLFMKNDSLKLQKDSTCVTLVLETSKEGKIIGYRFIQSLINVNYQTTFHKVNRIYEKNIAHKESHKKIHEIKKYYNNLEVGSRKDDLRHSQSPARSIIQEFMNIYSEALAQKLLDKRIPNIFKKHKIIQKDKRKDCPITSYYVKSTSPMKKRQAFLNQMLAHDFVLKTTKFSRRELIDFWLKNEAALAATAKTKQQLKIPKRRI